MMELEDSEDECDNVEEDLISLGEVGLCSPIMEDKTVDSPMKKKNKWGPILQPQRPRRHPEDGKTTIQKAMEYAKYRNLEVDYKPGNSFASSDNHSLNHIADKVDLKLGIDASAVDRNIDTMKLLEKENRMAFEAENPDLNLPGNLNVELQWENFPPLPINLNSPNSPSLRGVGEQEISSSGKQKKDKTWSQVVLENPLESHTVNSNIVTHDRCILEYKRPE